MAINGNVQLGATKADIISGIVQKELKFAAKLLPMVTDYSALAVKGAKSVSILKASSFVVENRASAVAGTQQLNPMSAEKLDLDINAYISWIVDSVDEYQSNANVQQVYATRAAQAHARYVDQKIAETLQASAGYLTAGPIDKDKILDMREFLKKNYAGQDLTLVVSPSQEKSMLKINEFVQAQIYGSANIPNGIIGKVFGVNVLVHEGLETVDIPSKAFMFSKEAIAFAFQMNPNYAEMQAIDYGTKAMKVAIDQLFGLMATQKGELGLGAGLSPFIAALS